MPNFEIGIVLFSRAGKVINRFSDRIVNPSCFNKELYCKIGAIFRYEADSCRKDS